MTRAVRRGFTLVELLVVMSLVVVLAGLAVAVSESGAFGSQKVVSAADRASGWLLVAKQRALRDRRPVGVRFLLTPAAGLSPSLNPPTANADPNFYAVREAQYIEQTDAYVPGAGRPTSQKPYLAFVYQQTTPPKLMSWVTDSIPPLPVGTPTNPYQTKFPANWQRLFLVFPPGPNQSSDGTDFTQRVGQGSLLVLPAFGAAYRVDQVLGPQNNLSVVPAGSLATELVLGQGTNVASATAASFTYPDLGAAISQPSAAATGPHYVTMTDANFSFAPAVPPLPAGSLPLPFPRATGQPLVGEPVLQLTGQTIILDVRLNNTTLQPTTSPTVTVPTTGGVSLVVDATGNLCFDILFAPSGQVLGANGGLVCLWVRDGDKAAAVAGQVPDFNTAGEQVLVTVYPRTGMIATHPVTNGTDPYAAAKDGLNSGL